jgi:hypothetical protein
MLTVSSISDPSAGNDLLRPLPNAHVLQTWEWGEFKRRTTGWTAERLAFLGMGSRSALRRFSPGGSARWA